MKIHFVERFVNLNIRNTCERSCEFLGDLIFIGLTKENGFKLNKPQTYCFYKLHPQVDKK